MRDIKLVAYLKDLSDEDERLITNYLLDKGVIVDVVEDIVTKEIMQVPRIIFYSIDTKRVMIEALEAESKEQIGQIMDQETVINEQNVVLEAHAERIVELEALIAVEEEEPIDGAVASIDPVDGD
jgi:hypothetical protein